MRLALPSGFLFLWLGGAASAAPILSVYPTIAPNVFGSPNWTAWLNNAIASLEAAPGAPLGNSTLPDYYRGTVTQVDSAAVVVTGFPSWNGQVDPGTVFGSAFAGESGNRMHFGLRIDGNGEPFSISQLSFTASSDDPNDLLGFSSSAGTFSYSDSYVGVVYNPAAPGDMSQATFITSGANTQLVDALVGRGRGNSMAADCPACSLADQFNAILAAAGSFGPPSVAFTGVYTLTYGAGQTATGSGTFQISGTDAVPEPPTWSLLAAGFAAGAVGWRRRGRRSGRI